MNDNQYRMVRASPAHFASRKGRYKLELWGCSSVGERLLCKQEVTGSNPVSSTRLDEIKNFLLYVHAGPVESVQTRGHGPGVRRSGEASLPTFLHRVYSREATDGTSIQKRSPAPLPEREACSSDASWSCPRRTRSGARVDGRWHRHRVAAWWTVRRGFPLSALRLTTTLGGTTIFELRPCGLWILRALAIHVA